MSDCIFCQIVKGESPSSKIFEDADTFAFLAIPPINRGHVLVVPKKHSSNIYDIDENDLMKVMRTAHMLAPKIKQAVIADGINIVINNDKAAGQQVFHVHVHIIPRFLGDGFQEWRGNPYQQGEIDSIHDIIAQEFK